MKEAHISHKTSLLAKGKGITLGCFGSHNYSYYGDDGSRGSIAWGHIRPGQKLVQFILIPVRYDSIEVVDDAGLHVKPTERGEGGFGSTGNGLKN